MFVLEIRRLEDVENSLKEFILRFEVRAVLMSV